LSLAPLRLPLLSKHVYRPLWAANMMIRPI
jgi:hypothetical protein